MTDQKRAPIPADRVRNIREWNAARAGQLSGAAATVVICDELLVLRDALTRIASFDDKGANEYLEATGSYSRFDEPGAVKIAREALKAMSL
jgi:hypothetical protein